MMPEDTNKKKSFWERPEGTTGMLALALGGVGLYAALPTLIAFMTGIVALLGQTIAAVCLSLVLGALLFLITNKKVQTLVSYFFRSAMRAITGVFVEIEGSEAGVAAIARALGRGPQDYVTESYRGLFLTAREARGLPVADMLFDAD